ncbi:MAG: glycerophosphodiester phosphodiesterase [Bacteroidetes bacterium]|nr:glycerophosphodiester phosphodiesterase [Bacteroidota bacterium]
MPTPEGFDVQGHRGARGLMPENTIPAFQRALDLGVHTVEMDVVVSADRQLIVSHEPWFHHHISTTPGGDPIAEAEAPDYNIFEMTVDDVQAFDVGRRGHPRFPQQQTLDAVKPTLRAAIEAMEHHATAQGVAPVRYNIETKSRPAWYGTYQPQPNVFAELLRNELQDLGVLDRTIIQSFDPATLVAFRELTDAGATALLVSTADDIDPAISVLGFTPDILSPNYEMVDEDLLAHARAAGMQVIPWTVNEPAAMERLIALGVDGLITDYPNRIAGRPLSAE